MSTAEQELLEKWRDLLPEQQQQVLDFAESLVQKTRQRPTAESPLQQERRDDRPNTPLGERLRAIRAKIVASGGQLLTVAELEQELAAERNRLADPDA
jgi:hypothetical protein